MIFNDFDFKFKKGRKTQTGTLKIGVWVNGADVGKLIQQDDYPDCLFWTPNKNFRHVRFQFRNQDTFVKVIDGIYKYKCKIKIKYLVVGTTGFEYASSLQLSKERFENLGFKSLPFKDDNFLYLE